MGMSPKEYWEGSAELTKAYEKAYKLKKEERNFEFWLQGLYFYHALNVALNNIFSSGTPAEYMSEPIRLFPPTEEEIEEEQKKEAAKLEATLNAFAERVKKRDELG